MSKQKVVKIGTEARDKVINGANFLADAVKMTLGPAGLNAISGIQGGTPRITNDGVSIAREISSDDELEDLGIRTLREAAQKTNDEAGDGTTTATTLAQAILKQALFYLPKSTKEGYVAGKKSPSEVLKMIKAETEEVVAKIVDMAQPVTSREDLIKIARVSVENDELAELIGGAQWDLGKDGTILAEETNEFQDSIERVKGVRIDNGFGTSHMINNLEKGTLEVEDCAVILTTYTMHDLNPLKNVLETLRQKGLSRLVVIARAWSQDAVKICAGNHKNGFFIYPLNAPYVDQGEIMKDLSAVTRARFIHEEDGSLEDMNLTDVGYAKKVVASRWNAIITGEDEPISNALVEARLKELKEQVKGTQSTFEKRNLESRISQLENGFAVVKVGALSESERQYKKDKVDDAVNAVKAALQEGVVAGAGQALKQIASDLPETYLLKKALTAPYDQIMANAGGEFEVPEWVKDPAKVVRIALEKASSVAGALATTTIAINWKNDRPKYVEEVKNED